MMKDKTVYGIWHRPDAAGTEKDLQGIRNTLDVFEKTGIGLVFLETYYHGMAAYRSDLVPYHTDLEACGYGRYPDYLSAFCAEAKERGIQVHAWVEDFYLGVKENDFTRNRAEWLLCDRMGEIRQSEGNGYLFLDPANEEVRSFLIALYRDILLRFPSIGGLNLDYIRYPLSDRRQDTGYTVAAMRGFREGFTGTRDDFARLLEGADAYDKWTDFRASCVTRMVEGVRDLKKEFPSTVLSTAIFPERENSYAAKKQDFTTWLNRGYLDCLTPMAYYDDERLLRSALRETVPFCGTASCLAGISAIYHSLSVDEVMNQVEICLEEGTQGVVFFGSQFLLQNDEYRKALRLI